MKRLGISLWIILLFSAFLVDAHAYTSMPLTGGWDTPTTGPAWIIDANFAQVETDIAAKENVAVVQATAPADLTIDWYDTDQEPDVLVHKRHNGSTWVRVGSYGIIYQADCSTITVGMCVDTDDGVLYYYDGSSVTAVGTGAGTGDIEGVTAGTGLSGGGDSGAVTVSIDPTYTQRRVSSTCDAGSSIRAIAEDGTVTCETDDTGSGSVPDGTVDGQVLLWSATQWVASTFPGMLESGSYTPTGTWIWTSATATWPTFNQNTTGSAATLTTPRTIAGTSFDGSANIDISFDNLTDQPAIPTASDTAYDATSWNGNTDVPTKNAVRDKIETLGSAFDPASPGEIGGTTPAAGTFTTITAATYQSSAADGSRYSTLPNNTSAPSAATVVNGFYTYNNVLYGVENSGAASYLLMANDIGVSVQAHDANMISWPSAIDATEVGYLDGLTEALSTTLANKVNTSTIIQSDDCSGETPTAGVLCFEY